MSGIKTVVIASSRVSLIEAAQINVTGGKETIRSRKARIVLNREKQLRHRLIEAASKSGRYRKEKESRP
jgi:hypothetical protein